MEGIEETLEEASSSTTESGKYKLYLTMAGLVIILLSVLVVYLAGQVKSGDEYQYRSEIELAESTENKMGADSGIEEVLAYIEANEFYLKKKRLRNSKNNCLRSRMH